MRGIISNCDLFFTREPEKLISLFHFSFMFQICKLGDHRKSDTFSSKVPFGHSYDTNVACM